MLLEIDNISYTVDSLEILKDVSFSLTSGQLIGIIGPNGAGKTTLIKLIAGLIEATQGDIHLDKRSIKEFSPKERAQLMAAVHAREERPAFAMSVADYIALGRTPYQDWLGSKSEDDIRQVQNIIDKNQLHGLTSKSLDTLSSGEFQKIQLARVLVQEPSLLLLDEPTSHLDIQAQIQLMKRLEEIVSEGIAVLIILHDLNLASLFCQELLLLSEGQCVVKGTPKDVLKDEYLKPVYGHSIATHYHHETGQLMIVPVK